MIGGADRRRERRLPMKKALPVQSHRAPGIDRRADFTIEQDHASYTAAEHAIWRTLFHRQERLLRDRACDAFLDGLARLGVVADGIPDFRRLNPILSAATGWTIVAVPGLVPDEVFFEHLANRRFPSTCFIRRPDQLDYLQEPDIFHDLYGHVPMLIDPVFADYMQAYGRGGLKATQLGSLERLARLYWYTVEFGLIRTPAGLRIYGSGILASKGESIYSLESEVPNRLGFDLLRIMRTEYRIDDFQESYFVIDGFDQLFEATRPDFAPYYERLRTQPDLAPDAVLASDVVLSQTRKKGRARGTAQV
jgi:phenylalanine-4-hydroxylase